jgi:drug/metabolite transporter (DMT)-like permease
MTLAVTLAVVSGFLWAITNTIDKVIVSRHITRPFLVVIVGSLLIGIIGLILLPFSEPVSLAHAIVLFLSAISSFLASGIYFAVIKREEPSRIVPLLGFITIFITLLSGIFLEEVFDSITYTGIGIIFIGGWAISSRSRNLLSPFQSSVFPLMMLASFLWSVHLVLEKYLLDFYSVITVISYDHITHGLVAVLLLPFFLSGLKAAWRGRKKSIFVIWANELIAFDAFFLYLTAASMWFVSLVAATTSIQYLFVFLIAIALHRYRPELLNEEVNRKIIAQKIVAIFLIVGGIFLISL